jgi:hypothetical protein
MILREREREKGIYIMQGKRAAGRQIRSASRRNTVQRNV